MLPALPNDVAIAQEHKTFRQSEAFFILHADCLIFLKSLFIILSLLVAFSCMGWGQTGGNLKQKKIAASGTVFLDSMVVIPHSIRVNGADSSHFQFDAATNSLVWKKSLPADSVTVIFRHYPFSIRPAMQNYRYDSVLNRFRVEPRQDMLGQTPDRFLDFGNLTYSGSFGRSLSFGNAQDAVLNSQFNLQINGYLADSIMVAAAITDNNIPVQPDGTTQYLNEFDNVWIRFSKKNWMLNLGDIDVRKNPSHFLNYFKRQQGLAFDFSHSAGKSATAKHFVSAAISKGKFTRNLFNGIEGSQGPYRLNAPNGELYFMVLAGTEKVYVDGVLMERGEDRDYVINYNTAEIKFTPRILVTRDKRIQVEFEYADRNYLNALLYLEEDWQIGKKLNVRMGIYNNSDSKNSPINQVLTGDQQDFLAGIGDNIQNALYPSIVKMPFEADRVLYLQKDTTLNGQIYPYYQQVTTPVDSALSVAFSNVGQGNGHYRMLMNASNGTAFEWVPPVNGLPAGDYEPVLRLVTPKSHQMGTLVMDYAFRHGSNLLVEGAWSRYNLNTFSKTSKPENGLGFKATLIDIRPVFRRGKDVFVLNSRLFLENLNEAFRPPERLREVEFLRDWGLPFDLRQTSEQLSGVRMVITDSTHHELLGDVEKYDRGDGYAGMRSQLKYVFRGGNWNIVVDGKKTAYSAVDFSGHFLRPVISASKRFGPGKQFEFGGSWFVEENTFKAGEQDTLQFTSFSFRDTKGWLAWKPQTDKEISVEWVQRKNQHPLAKGFIPEDISDLFTLKINLLSGKVQQLRVHAGYRSLRILTPGITNQQDDETLLGRFEYTVNLWKGLLLGKLLYESGAGQEQQRNYTFVEVPAGRGEYTWIDYNDDGLQQLNEFEIAQFTDQAKFVRLLVPSNIYVKSSYQVVNYNLLFNPPAVWRNVNGLKKFISKWNAQSTLQTNNQHMAGQRLFFNPFIADAGDSNFVSQLFQWSNTLSYNRFSSRWGLDFTQLKNLNKALLMYGFESRLANTYSLKGRWNISKNWMLQGIAGTVEEELATPGDKFQNRNYTIRGKNFMPTMVYTQSTKFRFQTSVGYEHKKGISSGEPQQMTDFSAAVETKYNILQKGIISGKFAWHQIGFGGTPNSTVSYAILKGLEPGGNMLWNLEFTRRILRNVEMSFNYNGRKPGNLKTIHTGTAALRAIL